MVGKQGAVVRRTSQRLQVTYDNTVLRTVRLRDVSRVAIIGNIQITASALTALLDAGVETSLFSLSGRLRGRLVAPENGNIFLRRSQVLAAERPDFCLQVARKIVSAKLRNARRLVQRHHQNHASPPLAAASEHLHASRRRVLRAANLDSLRGVEGDAGRVYFSALGEMVRGEVAFCGRSRRPPRDQVNAALSFGYALLTGDVECVLTAEGLDPGVGFLHGYHYGRPSLALDLVEEFRQPAVDRLVLSLVNRRVLRAEHFTGTSASGVLLNDTGRALFVEAYQDAVGERDGSGLRGVMCRQAGRMRACIESGSSYAPYHAP
jgi:CRISPR-associated protein Cas1